MKPTDIQLTQIRQAVSRILELPREGVGAIVLIPFSVDNGDDTGLRMITMGVSSEFAAVILTKAARVAATERPIASGVCNSKLD